MIWCWWRPVRMSQILFVLCVHGNESSQGKPVLKQTYILESSLFISDPCLCLSFSPQLHCPYFLVFFFFFRICYILRNEIEGSGLIFLVVISQLISWNLIWRKMGSDYCITSILHRISVEVFFYRCVESLQQNQSKIWCESLT